MRPSRIVLPPRFLAAESTDKTKDKPDSSADIYIYLSSLFLRELLSTFTVLLLSSRLGGDMIFTPCIVNLYVNIVFRRPLINPFVLTLACVSAGDWQKANVSGFPGYSHATQWWEIALYWSWILVAQLSGAAAAAGARAYSGNVLGDEFIKNAASGTGQMYLRADPTATGSCWNGAAKFEVPIRLGNATDLLRDGCMNNVQWRWWFLEDTAAVLFLIVGYIHIWRSLRWKDMGEGNANETNERYWVNIIAFPVASATLGLMTVVAFPTAHAGLHTSMYTAVFQALRTDLTVTDNAHFEYAIRGFGGMFGCALALAYEQALAWTEEARGKKSGHWLSNLMHKVLYISALK